MIFSCFFLAVGLCFMFLLIGSLLYSLGFKRSGFYLLASFGAPGRWLSSHCPYPDSCNCRIWTCSAYPSCPRRFS